jgi:hypothetical protein
MRWLSASVAASSCALLLAGCGGDSAKQTAPKPRPPRIPADLARQLAAEADLIASAQPGSCTARAPATRLQGETIRAIQAHRLPARYQEPLTSATNDLVARLAQCTEPTRRNPEQPKHPKHEKKKHGKDD